MKKRSLLPLLVKYQCFRTVLSANIWLQLELEPKPKLWSKSEPEIIISAPQHWGKVHQGGSILLFFGISSKVKGLRFPQVPAQHGELPNFVDFGSKTSESFTPLKVHKFKKSQGQKKKILFLKNVFFNAYIIVEDNQILNNTFFYIFFIF